MKYLGETKIEKSYTRYDFILSRTDIDSLRIIIERAIPNLNDCDDHVVGFCREFCDIYPQTINSEAMQPILNKMREDLNKVEIIPLD